MGNEINTHSLILSVSMHSCDFSFPFQEDSAPCLGNCILTLELHDGTTCQSEILLELSFLSFDAAGLNNIEIKAPDGTILTPSAIQTHETMRHYSYVQTQVSSHASNSVQK